MGLTQVHLDDCEAELSRHVTHRQPGEAWGVRPVFGGVGHWSRRSACAVAAANRAPCES